MPAPPSALDGCDVAARLRLLYRTFIAEGLTRDNRQGSKHEEVVSIGSENQPASRGSHHLTSSTRRESEPSAMAARTSPSCLTVPCSLNDPGLVPLFKPWTAGPVAK
jgi:hypothetical protein